MSKVKISYDELWKDALENLFPYFIELVIPAFYSDVDWEKNPIFLDKELHQISPKSEESKRYVDRLVRVFMIDGEERWVLVHVEAQGYRDTNFSRRMFIYFYRIFDKFNRDVLSLVVFSELSSRYKPSEFSYQFYTTKLEFKYQTYKILEQDDEKLQKSNNPFALVVLAAKKSLESRKDEQKRFRFKRELVKLMLEKGYGREEIVNVFKFLDGILALEDLEKEKIIYNEMKRSEVKEVAYLTPFERIAIEEGMKKGMEEGIEKGIEEGMEKGMEKGMKKGMLQEARELVKEALEEKFGVVPEYIQEKLQEIQEEAVLRKLLRQSIKASSLEEFSKSLQ